MVKLVKCIEKKTSAGFRDFFGDLVIPTSGKDHHENYLTSVKLCPIFHYLFSLTLLLQHRRGMVDANPRRMALKYLTSVVLCRPLILGAIYTHS